MFVYIEDCQEEGLRLHCTTLIPNLVLSACSPGLFMSFTAVEKVLCIWRYVPMPNLLVYSTGLLVTMPEFDPRLNPIFSFSSPACVSWLCPYLHDTFPSWPTKDPPSLSLSLVPLQNTRQCGRLCWYTCISFDTRALTDTGTGSSWHLHFYCITSLGQGKVLTFMTLSSSGDIDLSHALSHDYIIINYLILIVWYWLHYGSDWCVGDVLSWFCCDHGSFLAMKLNDISLWIGAG